MLSSIVEIKEVRVVEANQLLKKGFELIKPPVKIQKDGDEHLLYVLVKCDQ